MIKKISLKKLILITIFSSLLSLCIIGEGFAKNLPSLLSKTDETALISEKSTIYDKNRIRVSVDFSLIKPDSKRKKMKASLPDRDIILKKERIEERSADNYTWFGVVERKKLSAAVITVIGKSAIGYINIDGDSYSLEPDKSDYLVIKNDVTKMLPFDFAPKVPEIEKKSNKSVAQALATEDGSRIDVLVLYTQDMVNTYGSDLDTMIQNFVDLANQAYSNSGLTAPRLNLVHSELYTDSSAVQGLNISKALDYITNDTNLATERNTYKADLVSLLRHYGSAGSCGLGWMMTTVDNSFSDKAFSVVEVKKTSEVGAGSYYCDSLSFAHELGHNMGCEHDRANAGGQPGAYPYSYGYSFFVPSLSKTFGTVMSYAGTTIPYFSNPNVNYNDIPNTPTGKAESDPNSAYNAKTIDNTKVVVSNFKISASTTTTITSTTTTTSSTTTTTIPCGNKKPIISKLSKTNGKPGVVITITGRNFCDFQGQVLFGSKTANVSDWSNQSITAQVPNIKSGKSGKSVSVKVKSSNGKSSNTRPFTVLPAK